MVFKVRIFVIRICSYLVEQYPIIKSMYIAKLCFNVTTTFSILVAPALRECALKEDIINLLIKLGQIQISRLASTQTYFIFALKPLQNCRYLRN
uniref:Uncharacterized protein n=1 Tax=Tetranychus urticae TaxID=32264 RepID=T1KSC5_TETUR